MSISALSSVCPPDKIETVSQFVIFHLVSLCVNRTISSSIHCLWWMVPIVFSPPHTSIESVYTTCQHSLFGDFGSFTGSWLWPAKTSVWCLSEFGFMKQYCIRLYDRLACPVPEYDLDACVWRKKNCSVCCLSLRHEYSQSLISHVALKENTPMNCQCFRGTHTTSILQAEKAHPQHQHTVSSGKDL